MLKKLMGLLLALCMCLASAGAEEATLTQKVLAAFLAGEYTQVEAMCNDEVRAAVGAEQLKQAWEMQLTALGSFVEVADSSVQNGADVLTLRHERGAQNLVVVWDDQGKIAGLMLQPAVLADAPAPKVLPDGTEENEVVLFAETARQLSGKIVVPAEKDAPYVVFVHGSGPSDMNETIYANQPFRDLAYDLAAQGIGSIRFDKVTYAHPEYPCETVVQEYLEPVQEAVRVLKETVDATKVYILGHSQGGMLMPWLMQECDAAGGIALAGTPCELWEISYQQNLDIISLSPKAQQLVMAAVVEAERGRAEKLAELSDAQAQEQTIFGINAYYLKHMAAIDQLAIARESGKPMLMLWGERDVQVARSHHEAWQTGLGDSELYTYITYPELNHLFVPAQEGERIDNIASCYAIPAQVDTRVAADIAAWIKEAVQ